MDTETTIAKNIRIAEKYTPFGFAPIRRKIEKIVLPLII